MQVQIKVVFCQTLAKNKTKLKILPLPSAAKLRTIKSFMIEVKGHARLFNEKLVVR